MAALADLPTLDGHSCPERPDTFMQPLCRSVHGIASRCSISVAISSRACTGSGMSGTEAMRERISRIGCIARIEASSRSRNRMGVAGASTLEACGRLAGGKRREARRHRLPISTKSYPGRDPGRRAGGLGMSSMRNAAWNHRTARASSGRTGESDLCLEPRTKNRARLQHARFRESIATSTTITAA